MNEVDQLILDWQAVASKKDQLTELERAMRERICRHVFGAIEDQPEGTKNHELGKGYKLTAKFGRNRKVTGDADEIAAIVAKLKALGCEEADQIFKAKHELSVSTYKALSEPARNEVNKLIVTSHALPTLELKEPKK